jgi:hypothetical protein
VTALLLCNAPLRDLGQMAIVQCTQAMVPHPGGLTAVRLDPDASPAEVAGIVASIPPPLEQVVLSGVFLDRHALEQSLAFATASVAAGARFVVHNLSLEAEAGTTRRPDAADVLERAAALDLRDHRTATQISHWGIARAPDPGLSRTAHRRRRSASGRSAAGAHPGHRTARRRGCGGLLAPPPRGHRGGAWARGRLADPGSAHLPAGLWRG